ncbi:sugar phosphate isomerase/epimerase family protein [Halegenticoccus tardaugens]|uniref:sugar phosphate isomerase/epimerase family protein n=1 Tax=Halegenticoccus tardaugens TaxID=2071624 RepID=UPI00100BE145|nr:sugar phosphate isomerase/epimerase [Halegenticoccus tardaugens]
MQTGINLFTLRGIHEPLPRVLERVADAGYDGVEFLHRLPGADENEVVRTLDRTGLAVPGAHLGPFTDLSGLPGELERTLGLYDAVGCEALAVSIGEERLGSRDVIHETATRLEKLAAHARERDVGLLYHNHHWEFRPLDGSTPFDILLDELDERIGVELDVGWAAACGDDPVKRIRALGNRLSILHVKDVDVTRKASVEVGTGDVDLAACIEAAAAEGVKWCIYEHDEPDDPLDSLDRGVAFLERFR